MELCHNYDEFIIKKATISSGGKGIIFWHKSECYFVIIEDDGRLKDTAFTYMTGKRLNYVHPTTGAVFSESKIPNNDKCKALVKSLLPRIARLYSLTSWHLSFNEACKPILVELNLLSGGLFFHQITNGPVFGELRKNIINNIFR